MEKLRYTFMGRDITDLTHEELLVAIRWAVDALNTERRMSRTDREMEKLFADTRTALEGRHGN